MEATPWQATRSSLNWGPARYRGVHGAALPRRPLAGIIPQASYRTKTVLFNRSDLLIAHIDGLSEAEDHEGRAFGIDPCRDAGPLSCQRSALDGRSALRPARRRSAVRSRRAPG